MRTTMTTLAVLAAMAAAARDARGQPTAATSACFEAGPDVVVQGACEKLCASGDLYGCNNLAVRLGEGTGAAEKARARELFERACGEVATACNNAGMMSDGEWGLPGDSARAVRFFVRGCDARVPEACERLAFHLDRGDGVARDLARADTLYDFACSNGRGHACTNLGLDVLHRGESVKARELFRRGCDLVDNSGCFELGWQFETLHDLTVALAYYGVACELKSAKSCYNLAVHLKAAGDEIGREAALVKMCAIAPPHDPVDASESKDVAAVCEARRRAR
jgi:TPR repeat protein